MARKTNRSSGVINKKIRFSNNLSSQLKVAHHANSDEKHRANENKNTLKAFEIVDFMRSRMNPPARVPTIPHTIVIPPNIKSALL